VRNRYDDGLVTEISIHEVERKALQRYFVVGKFGGLKDRSAS
jgi:hypothetical protein